MSDAAVVGSGPNGLAAAVMLARAGLKVELWEKSQSLGGGLRSTALFDEDIVHDVCSTVHPMAAASRFFREFDLQARGVRLLQPDIPYAHPLLGRRGAVAWRSLERTAQHLGPDGPAWCRLMQPLVERSEATVDLLLSSQRSLPRDLPTALVLGRRVLSHAGPRSRFRGESAGALLAGVSAHAVGPLPSLASSAVGALLGHLAHSSGWPLIGGGSARIADALVEDFLRHGGTVNRGHRIRDLSELDGIPLVMLDISPREFTTIAAARLPRGYRRSLERYRYGPGAAKVDFLVNSPVPWTDPLVGQAGTVHLGGTRADVFRRENATSAGQAIAEPFVLVVDPAVTDPGREVNGKRPVWAYAHVPNNDERDPTDLVRRQIEKYAPGFSDTIIASRGLSAHQYESYNPNYVGGDIGSGAITIRQTLARPTLRWDPYTTPLPGVYLCSSATPPGPSVHGMCGYLAAQSALRREHGLQTMPDLGPRPDGVGS